MATDLDYGTKVILTAMDGNPALVIGAHPDDSTFMGGTIYKLSQFGKVYVVNLVSTQFNPAETALCTVFFLQTFFYCFFKIRYLNGYSEFGKV